MLSLLGFIGLGLLGMIHLCLWGTVLGNLIYLQSSSRASTWDAPPVSICIPARNEADNLRRLLPSLLRQNYPSLEIIVWDDGSDDDTWAYLQSIDDARLRAHRGADPPSGWIGKVHALYQCTRRAEGDQYVFLDADAELTGDDALQTVVRKHLETNGSVSSGFPRLRGGAQLLVSLVPYALLTGLPWPLVARTSLPAMSALNGQCWLIDAEVYHAEEPHAEHRASVLEDVAIGRYLKRLGHAPALLDVQTDVSVYMYSGLSDAWQGFRKNAYLLLGGSPGPFVGMFSFFALVWVVSPLLSPWFLVSLYGLKFVTDRAGVFATSITLMAPASFVLGLALQVDSAIHHWTDRVAWKGRSVPSSGIAPDDP